MVKEDFASFQAGSVDAGFSDWLRAENQATWDAMVGHRFCLDMAADRLPEPAFVRYLRYEDGFVRAAIGIFAYALAKAPTAADQDHLIRVLGALAGEQEDYFRRTFTRLGLDPEPALPEALPEAALGLRAGVLAIAAAGSFAEILAAMLGGGVDVSHLVRGGACQRYAARGAGGVDPAAHRASLSRSGDVADAAARSARARSAGRGAEALRAELRPGARARDRLSRRTLGRGMRRRWPARVDAGDDHMQHLVGHCVGKWPASFLRCLVFLLRKSGPNH
jgi:hypothetical protein